MSATVVAALVAVVVALVALPASAQVGRSAISSAPELPTVAEGTPVLLEADTLTYDSSSDTVTATGNATVYYGTYTVFADRIVYDRANDTVIAYGNVLITEEGGTVVEAEEIELRDELSEGFIFAVTAILSNDARIGAARGQRIGGNVTEFEQAVYTACKPCEENPDKPLTWQLRASKVRHDEARQIIEYRNVVLQLFGIPVFYFPYFQHPDPTVKRQSGFLTPSLRISEAYGVGVRVPYFFNLAPHYDLTFSPLITTDQGPLLEFEWRHKPTTTGYYTVTPAFIWQADPSAIAPGNETFRGSIETTGNFALDDQWTFGWDATAATDDTFRQVYDIDDATDLVSEIHLTGISERNYFTVRGYMFEALLASDVDSMTPAVHPVIDHNYIFDDPVWGGELALDTEVVSLSRDVGADSTRISSNLHWQRSFIGSMGQVVTPFADLRGDLYATDNVPDPTVPGGVRGNETFGRVMPSTGIEVSWPHARYDNLGTHVVEPMAQFVIRPNETRMSSVPNEDALSLNYEAANLFEVDKFSGVDRYEGGTRANTGVRYTLSDVHGGTTVGVIGQSYHVGGPNPFAATSGLSTDTSDLVTGLSYRAPDDTMRASWRGRFDNGDLDTRVNEFSFGATHENFSVDGAYAYVAPEANQVSGLASEEIAGRASVDIFQNWSLHGGATYDLDSSMMISDYVGLGYDDDCFAVNVTFAESYFADRDIEPEKSLTLTFTLKTIGSTSFSRSVGDSGASNTTTGVGPDGGTYGSPGSIL